MSVSLQQLVRLAVEYRQTKLFIAPAAVYGKVRDAAQRAASLQGFREIDTGLNPEAACDQFRSAGRAGNVILIKAINQVGVLETMIYVWHQSGAMYGAGRGELMKADGTTDCSDYTREGCVVMLFVTPEAYRRMNRRTLQLVYPPKDAYYFRSEQERSWDIFKS